LRPGDFERELIGQKLLDELRVIGIVLKQQNSQLRPHDNYFMLPGGGSLIIAQKTPSSLTALTKAWKSTGLTT
jgi:hypothetical protein